MKKKKQLNKNDYIPVWRWMCVYFMCIHMFGMRNATLRRTLDFDRFNIVSHQQTQMRGAD